MNQRLWTAILVIAFLFALAVPAQATHRMGEKHPPDYATNSCARWAYDLATDRRSYTVAQFDFKMHTKGCVQNAKGSWVPARTRCMNLARYFATSGVTTTSDLRRKMNAYGCVQSQNGTWGNRA